LERRDRLGPVALLDERGWKPYGVDTDVRGDFFGE
jgi:hypothetical protein